GMWADVPQRLAELSRILQRFAPTGGDTRGIGAVSFGPNATTRGLWNPDQNAVAFVATLPANSTQHFKWRAGAYSTYTLFGWSWGITHDSARDARAPLLTGTGDDPNQDIGRTAIRIQIQPQAFIDSAAVSPQSIDWVDRPSTLLGVGEQNRFTTVQLAGGGGPYTEQALIPIIGDAGGGITENRLRAAGRNYPTDITAVYLPLPDGAVGPAAQAILDQVEATFGSKAAAEAKPYDLARAIESYLHDPANFQYQTDVQAAVRAQCDGISTVECFARIRRGYCEYYASTMTVLLRAAGIPARVAYGFLPGTRTPDGIESVPASAAHWWVEVYFPRSGWVEFDPTGGVGQPEQLPSGAPVTPPPSGLFTLRPDRETDVIPRSSGGGGGVVTNRPTGSGPFVAVGVILAIAVVVIGWAARRRSPRAPMHPDQAWGGLGRLAARFGFGPRPEQTVYEYAGALSDLVPAARVEVGTVARAKVEVAYGRRELGVDRLRVVGDAYRRLRFAVLRAGLGRRFRRRKR
ncbi:MAG TPA: transglutaminase domain-containing protein, partial [Candidatus Acidoferrales bacterium]|nr:transglutaminase domain-containing protein [Candidatus Acidoferrales bacterium]